MEGPSEPIMPPKSLKSYGVPSPDGIPTGPTMPTIEVANFEIKPALINISQRNQFGGHPSETLLITYNSFNNFVIPLSTKESIMFS